MPTTHGAPAVLAGTAVAAGGQPALATAVCAEHLAWLGARSEPRLHLNSSGEVRLREEGPGTRPPGWDGPVECGIRWLGPGQTEWESAGSEATLQAISGLMGVHGRDVGVPRRLGLEVASAAAGIVAAQGVLAALIGRTRGFPVARVESSVLQAALLLLAHHHVIATCSDRFPFDPGDAGPGPPFCTADGHWVELEVLSGADWAALWSRLGVDGGTAKSAWLPFVYRYLAGSCRLPAALHAATRRSTLEALRQIAVECGAAVCRVRSYPEVLDEPGWDCSGPPWVISPGPRGPDPEPVGHGPAAEPLTGLRVVEVTSRLQGPLAGLLLHQLGADVIKVEPPGGDFGRLSPPRAGSVGAAYLAYNRGKQVVEIDYKHPEGLDRLAGLVAEADVFLHNWRSGRAEQLGLDYGAVSRRNRRLVYAHASGWGHPLAGPSPIAGDYLVQAHAACGEGLNPAGEPPFPSRLTLLDVTGGLLACEGILAGLYHRERTGCGCRVTTSLLAGALALQGHVLRAMASRREVGRYRGRALWRPTDRPLQTADGYLVACVEDSAAAARLMEVCGLTPGAGNGTAHELVAERLRRCRAVEWERQLLRVGIPAAVARTDLADLARDPRTAPALEALPAGCRAPAAPWRFVT
jgi:crotonobetainyl-CoA:carnitine CoA-transferase CaiB-like acyl-CoA transferase